jgi:hypothetical protein
MAWGPGDEPVEAEEGGDVSADGCGEVRATAFALSQQLDDEDAREMGQGLDHFGRALPASPVGTMHSSYLLGEMANS